LCEGWSRLFGPSEVSYDHVSLSSLDHPASIKRRKLVDLYDLGERARRSEGKGFVRRAFFLAMSKRSKNPPSRRGHTRREGGLQKTKVGFTFRRDTVTQNHLSRMSRFAGLGPSIRNVHRSAVVTYVLCLCANPSSPSPTTSTPKPLLFPFHPRTFFPTRSVATL
jgi:hypothetical protein